MRPLDQLFHALSRSSFRNGFALAAKEREYLRLKGMPTVLVTPAEQAHVVSAIGRWLDAQ